MNLPTLNAALPSFVVAPKMPPDDRSRRCPPEVPIPPETVQSVLSSTPFMTSAASSRNSPIEVGTRRSGEGMPTSFWRFWVLACLTSFRSVLSALRAFASAFCIRALSFLQRFTQALLGDSHSSPARSKLLTGLGSHSRRHWPIRRTQGPARRTIFSRRSGARRARRANLLIWFNVKPIPRPLHLRRAVKATRPPGRWVCESTRDHRPDQSRK